MNFRSKIDSWILLVLIVAIAGLLATFMTVMLEETSVREKLITTSVSVLGVALINVQEQNNFFESVVYGFGAALGFSLVLVLFAALRERINVADVPAPFQGSAIGLVTAGLMSLAFMGLGGLVKV